MQKMEADSLAELVTMIVTLRLKRGHNDDLRQPVALFTAHGVNDSYPGFENCC
jgi:hypothetical protein